jgi:predicted metal-dependent hydrolase
MDKPIRFDGGPNPSAEDFVLHYIVTHEMVHLAVPDHSRKFWLTAQSLCPETERARRWLVANGQRILAYRPPR